MHRACGRRRLQTPSYLTEDDERSLRLGIRPESDGTWRRRGGLLTRALGGKTGHGACNTHILSENKRSGSHRRHSRRYMQVRSAKQKVIQEGRLDPEEHQTGSLRMDSLDLTQSAESIMWTRDLHRNLACMMTGCIHHSLDSEQVSPIFEMWGCSFARYATPS